MIHIKFTLCRFNDCGGSGIELTSFLTWTSLHNDKFTMKTSFVFIDSLLAEHSSLIFNNIYIKENW